MQDIWDQVFTFLEEEQSIVAWTVGLSVLTFIGSLIAVPIVVIQMRPDFFVREKGQGGPLTAWRLVRRVAKNILGALLLLAGIAMLVLPGQGLLTIALGLSLLDFPGKRDLQLKLVRMKGVSGSIDWIRKKAEKPPLELPH
ncbi:PGPGW domain-containing protein [Pelagicoccus albus]|uniref:Transmembrane protein (PGPGW) n=1 Tax=Pelagicoccus albus TaxID=415222 RepID=A0A7X1B485_9BACT|nr:PGPGW domain-containing protein [Pelagicoccus albus]MBC2605356.1 hypothetical protein [Pelagicoccus albus]